MNVVRKILPRFYIFLGEKMCDDYIKQCKLRTCMDMQAKAWMMIFLFKEFLSFFKRSILGGISQTNHHLLILDGHGSHVTLEATKQALDFGLDMITLPSQTSHDVQPLNISSFKPFKTTFKK
jgi:hypothetical protein